MARAKSFLIFAALLALPLRAADVVAEPFPPAKLANLYIQRGELNGNTVSLQMQGDDLIYKSTQGKKVVETQTIHPTGDDWFKFIQALNAAKVYKWSPKYYYPGQGGTWVISFDLPDRSFSSEGTNDFPKEGEEAQGQANPSSGPSVPFQLFWQAVLTLVGKGHGGGDKMKILFIVEILALIAATQVHGEELEVPHPFPVATPSRFHFVIVNVFGRSLELTLDKGVVTSSRCESPRTDGSTPKTEKSVTPTTADWHKFIRALNRAGVYQWAPSYRNPDELDGGGWKIEMKVGRYEFYSKGDNGYPRDDGVYMTSGSGSPSDAFLAFWKAVCQLVAKIPRSAHYRTSSRR